MICDQMGCDSPNATHRAGCSRANAAPRFVSDAEAEVRMDRTAHGHPNPVTLDELRRWYWEAHDTRAALLEALEKAHEALLEQADDAGHECGPYCEYRDVLSRIRKGE